MKNEKSQITPSFGKLAGEFFLMGMVSFGGGIIRLTFSASYPLILL